MAEVSTSIQSLPNEVLIQALESFSTRSLLPIAAVSRRFRGLVGRLHYYRMVEATLLSDHKIILECYHPTVKLSTPSLDCEYLGTDGLAEAGADVSLDTLNGLYSRFRPIIGDEYRRPRARRPTRAVIEGTESPLVTVPSHDVHLEAGELFTQLCTVINLAKVGPRRRLNLSIAGVADGVIRVWRDWLANAAVNNATTTTPEQQQQRQQRASSSFDDPCILWTTSSKDVGVKFRVLERGNLPTPLLIAPGDEPAVSYTLEIQGELSEAHNNRLVVSIYKS